jgi:hypothetical protein
LTSESSSRISDAKSLNIDFPVDDIAISSNKPGVKKSQSKFSLTEEPSPILNMTKKKKFTKENIRDLRK